MYQVSNGEDEFQPRVTPKPASKFDCCIVPSVPEVSLIFEKSLKSKALEQKSFTSPSSRKGITHENASFSPSNNKSYATWKEQHFTQGPPVANVRNLESSVNAHHNQCSTTKYYSEEGAAKDGFKEYRETSYPVNKNIDNKSCWKQNARDESYDNRCKLIYEAHNDNRLCIKQKHTMRPPGKVHNSVSYPPDLEYSSLTNERKLMDHNSEPQKILFNNPISNPSVGNINTNPHLLNKSEFQRPSHQGYQHPYFDMNAYRFPHLYTTNCSSYTDNQETVKNLLQLINSQSEQIKSLQLQVDRLLKMQEENFKERQKCNCLSQMQEQKDQFRNNSCDAINTSNYITVPQNQILKQNTGHNTFVKESTENCSKSKNGNQAELLLAEAETQKAFMEQKVSIGVMTSFEFTVQNSPFPLDTDDYTEKEGHRKGDSLKMRNGINFCDTSETLRRYRNSFTRVPSAQLENIVEDSESHLSSSQQQSSNFNASVSTKDLEKLTYVDTQKETDISILDFPRIPENIPRKMNQSKIDEQRFAEKSSNQELRNYNSIKNPTVQKVTTAYDNHGATTYQENNRDGTNKVSSPVSDQCKKMSIQRHNCSTQVTSKNDTTDYSNYRKKEKKVTVSKQINCIEDSLILSGGDLKVGERPPPTPEPSIHVDMHEYSSDDDSEKVKRTSKVGWTFYNNVLGQVNQILQNSCVIEDQEKNQPRTVPNQEQDDTDNKVGVDTVKVTTLEQLRKLGISLNENSEFKELNDIKKMTFDSSFYPRLDHQANMAHTTSAVNETNTSIHMKALALKYLSDEQLAELALQRQGSTSLKHLMVSNVQGTNMSFATMRYLERYQLLPGRSHLQTEDINSKHLEIPQTTDLKLSKPKNNPGMERFPFSQTPRTTCPSKILDISTLKQQPKLL